MGIGRVRPNVDGNAVINASRGSAESDRIHARSFDYVIPGDMRVDCIARSADFDWRLLERIAIAQIRLAILCVGAASGPCANTTRALNNVCDARSLYLCHVVPLRQSVPNVVRT